MPKEEKTCQECYYANYPMWCGAQWCGLEHRKIAGSGSCNKPCENFREEESS